MDNLDAFLVARPPTPNRPLLGTTVLVVEDSRFACEAMRLLCIKSGARIRRADTLEHARQHLRVYRPSVVIVDIGLPDGSGEDLIYELAQSSPRVDAILGTSGDPLGEDLAVAAGADGFLLKPVSGLAMFQSTILSLLPEDRQPPGPRIVSNETVAPDTLALRDDFAHVAEVLDTVNQNDVETLSYVHQFLSGIARSANDQALSSALAQVPGDGKAARDYLCDVLKSRLEHPSPL